MNYVVRRQEQEFGPYTLTDLQEYVGTGHVLLADLAKSDGMADWVPVSEVLGNLPIASTVAPGLPLAVDAPPRRVSLPPNLHWLILAILLVVTQQYFNWVWALVQANWARKLSGSNRALVLTAMYPASFLAAICAGAFGAAANLPSDAIGGISGLLVLTGLGCYIFGIFSIRSAMEDYYNHTENIGLHLHGGMTWFFSTIYIQYHVNQIARWKKTGMMA